MVTFKGPKFMFFTVFLCFLLPLLQVSAIPTIGFIATSSNQSETSGLIIIGLTRTVQINESTSVAISFSGTATRGSDYIISGPSVVTFPANDPAQQNISLYILNDRDVESGPPETVNLTIATNAAYDRKPSYESHIVNIQDDDVNISCQNSRVSESAGSATVEITRSGSPQALSANNVVQCYTKDNTALTSSDYTTTNREITFTSSNNVQQISIPIINDTIPERNETLNLTCYSSDLRVRIASSCKDAEVTIDNDDTYVYFCPGYSTTIEENVGNYTVRLCRVGVLEETHTVGLCRSADSASLPEDNPSVQAQCDDIVFAAYEEVKELVIPVTNDTWGEQEYKTFNISMNTTDPGVTFNDTSYIVTIQDDDNTFYLTNVSEIQITEGAGSADVNVTIDRAGRTSVASNVSLVLDFTATAESADCSGTSPRVVKFAGGETSKTITACTVVDDRLVEDDETFNVTISGKDGSNVRTGRSERTVKLISNDVNVSCQHVSSIKEPNGPATIILERTGATALTTNNVLCSTANGTSFSPTDYQSQHSRQVSFALNEITKNISIIVENDNVAEANESFTVTCNTSDPRVVVDPSCIGMQINIINDDTFIYFCAGYSTFIEENLGNYTVRLCRVGVLEDTFTVGVCRTSDAVSLPHDDPSVQAQCDDIVFAAYEEVKELVIPVINDTWGEQEYKTFNISMNTTDAGVTFNDTTSYVVTIQDDDNTFYLTNVSEIQMTEGVGSAEVNVTINRAGRTSVASNVSLVLDFTATAERADCTGTSPRVVTFAGGETSKTITACTVVDDRLVEDDETFNVTISGEDGSNVRTGRSERTVKLISNDVNVSCQHVSSIKEPNGPATVTLDRTGATALTANNVLCSTANGTSFSPTDYQSQHSRQVSFALDEITKNISIIVENDNVAEANESFTVTCNTSDPRVVVDPSCIGMQINIINDDTFIYFCAGYSTSIEENLGNYTVRLCRVGVLEDTHTVGVCRSSDAVSLPHDDPSVQAQCDDIVFAAYEEVKELIIPVTNDIWGEQEYKTFNISMNTTDAGVTFNDTTSYIVTIQDDDNTFYLTNVSEIQMTEGVGSAEVNVTINRAGRTSVTSNVSLVLDFTATAERADCTGTSPRVVTFAGGETSKTITACTVVDDRLVEDDETFNVTISGEGGSNVRTGRSERTVKLISNDVNVTCQGPSLQETNGPATVRLDRTGATAITANNISCSTSNDTAISPTDFQPRTSATVSFAINDLTENFNVVIQDDSIVEANESFTVTCNTSDSRVVVDPSCIDIQINIINDDTYVYFCPGYSTAIGEENVGSYTVRLCRVGVLEDTHTVGVCRTSDAVFQPYDYPSVQAQCDDIVFAAYEEVKELIIPVINDTWGEQEYKTFNISMNTTDAGVTFNDTTSYVVTIHDDDNTFCFTRTSTKVYEEHDKFVNLTIRRTGAITVSNASVVINTSPQSAITPEDYTEPILNQHITFFVGEIIKNVSVNIVNDKLVEDDQTFQLSLTGVDGSTVFLDCKTSTVTIVSNDVNIFCRDRRGRQSVHENNGPVLMEFTREGSLQYNHTMRIRTVDGTAISGQDFTAIDKTLIFAPYQTKMRENVQILNDNVVEPDETFRLSVTSSDDRVHMICPGTDFTILNDDTFIRCANQSIEVNEGDKTATFMLKREGVLSSASPIWFSTKDGTAFDKSDYKPQNKVNRTFDPGQVYMTLSVELVDDEYNEDDETFSVIIGSHVPTTLTSGDSCVVITIKDNDPNRMTEQQAQELLARRRNFLIVLGVAGAFMALVVVIFLCCICHLYRQFKRF